MQIIKFRGKIIDDPSGHWLFGDLRHTSDGVESISLATTGDTAKVSPVTVGQFTGLKDHKGREIYEGDIVKVVSYGEESFHVVKYMIDLDYPAFDLEPAMDGDFNSLSYCMISIDTKITVIGNIHDNPELLRMTKK